MSLLSLIIAPNPILKKISKPVEKIDEELCQFMQDMAKIMYAEGGIGLAAVQIGVLKRVLVMDTDYEKDDEHDHHHGDSCNGFHVSNTNPKFFINPEIISHSEDKSVFKEGCLSFPEMRADVERPRTIKLKFTNLDGIEETKNFSGIEATCLQHEIDHLNGVTFVDHLPWLKREMIIKKMQKKLKHHG